MQQVAKCRSVERPRACVCRLRAGLIDVNINCIHTKVSIGTELLFLSSVSLLHSFFFPVVNDLQIDFILHKYQRVMEGSWCCVVGCKLCYIVAFFIVHLHFFLKQLCAVKGKIYLCYCFHTVKIFVKIIE